MSSRRYVVTIVEQPAPKSQRFRYASEINGMRSAGWITGVRSSPACPTYPRIRVEGYSGPMFVMLCLVNPYDKLVHPHHVTGKEVKSAKEQRYCKNGLFVVYTDGPDVCFNNIGILCVKGKSSTDIEAALNLRKDLKIDPFRKGFPHLQDHNRIDFSAVRLCFNVFLPKQELTDADRFDCRMYTKPLDSVLSDIIYDAKKLPDLKIVHLNDCVGSMRGGTVMVLLCERYNDPPPEVVFMEPGWKAKAHVSLYHKKLAIVFQAPPYRDPNCTKSVQVEVYLQKKNKRGVMEYSDTVTVEYIPDQKTRKRPPSDYLENKLLKKTLLEEYWNDKVPYPPQFVENPSPEQKSMDADPICSARPQTPGCWQQPSTCSTPHFLPPVSHLLSTHTTRVENVTSKEPKTPQNPAVDYVTSKLNKDIFPICPDYLGEASCSFDVNSLVQPHCSQSQYCNELQNSVATEISNHNIMPNLVPDSLIHNDHSPNVIFGANGSETEETLEDLTYLMGNDLGLDNTDQNAFMSDANADMLSGDLRNLQFRQNDDNDLL